jgi:hypothetical protein
VSSRNSIIRRSAILFAFLALAFASVLSSHSISVAYADSALTNGGATGAGDGAGNGSATADTTAGSESTASSHGKHSAGGKTDAGTNTTVNQGDTANNTHVKISTHAFAAAKSSRAGLEATASAYTTGESASNEGSSNAKTNSFNGGTATAKSTKRGGIAEAYSTSGGYASANSITKTVLAEVPGGTSATYTQGRKTVAIAYTDTGSFSFSMIKGKSAYASTGTTENIGALSSGDIKSIIHSAMGAEAGANPHYAYANAYSKIDALASNAYGYASANGYAYAHASVQRSGSKLTVTVVAGRNRDDSKQCDSGWRRRNTLHLDHHDDCVIVRKVIYLKKTTLHTQALRVATPHTTGHKNHLH